MARRRVTLALWITLLVVALGGLSYAGVRPGTAPGGAGPRPSVEGCTGEWLFNGIWRLKVLRVDAIRKPRSGGPGAPGWGVTTEIRNGSRPTVSMSLTGISGTGRGVDLVLPGGNTLKLDVRDFQHIVSRRIPQGGAIVHQLKYYYPHRTPDAEVQRPTKLLVEINPQKLRNDRGPTAGAAYSVANPSFRVRLDCVK